MPSSTFLNLAKEKQTKIINAAIKELSTVSFEKVSINKIIKDAEISRGSFYMYFEDLYDLTLYLMEQMKVHLILEIKNKVDLQKTNFEDLIITYYSVVFDYYNKVSYRNFFRNVIVYFQGRPEEELKALKNKTGFIDENLYLLNIINKEQFQEKSDEYIKNVIELGLIIFRNVMFKTFFLELNKHESIELLKSNLAILKHGYGRK